MIPNSLFDSADIFVTGGAGTLGWAIANQRKKEGWKGRLTVYSTDDHKHEAMRRIFPDIDFIQGDIRAGEPLYMAMIGHDLVIHAAAVKVIPTSERFSIDTFDVNVSGSMSVCSAAVRARVNHVIGISTDKACHPANAYGASKLMMEKLFQEYAREIPETETSFHLVRYGNVLASNGSVIQAWQKAKKMGQPIQITDPDMTRFWLPAYDAVKYLKSSILYRSGEIYIPKLKSLSLLELAQYSVNYTGSNTISEPLIEKIPMRPGEKMHETLLTEEEAFYACESFDLNAFILSSNMGKRFTDPAKPYDSFHAPRLTKEELWQWNSLDA